MKPEQKKAFIYSAELEQGGYPEACPFNTHRAGKTRETARSMGLLSGSDRMEVAPDRVARDELECFHTRAYLDALRRAGQGEHNLSALSMGLGTPDCPIFKDMYDYVTLAAGGSTTGARLLLDGVARIAFNPSGGFHHAHPGMASGFCYLNDIVLAANRFLDAGKRVLFLDVDVHHGDGVQDAFYDSNRVMTVSLHESGHTLFPGTGSEADIGIGEGTGYSVNLPLPVGTYDKAYRRVFDEGALPLIKAYNPDVVIFEVGMDGLAGDPLAHLNLTNNVYADIAHEVTQLGKPLLVTGGGGYHIENTVRGWALLWGVLCGEHEEQADAMMMGMGGVMLENTDWFGGLRDRVLLSDAGKRGEVDDAIDRMLETVRRLVFPIHGL
jgi:acetoin utilization protein AcuC